jgi:hypothetical protein
MNHREERTSISTNEFFKNIPFGLVPEGISPMRTKVILLITKMDAAPIYKIILSVIV